ncbi:MAG: hypothetical protein GYA56_04380 [Geobacteraceae bacterium]|nr:hypothetical protein [Geobacteraceae bacterium]
MDPTVSFASSGSRGGTGIEGLAMTRYHAPSTPFLMAAGSRDIEGAVECMKEGSWDFNLKEQPFRIGPAIDAALQKKRHKR